jgi:hypothetical protein
MKLYQLSFLGLFFTLKISHTTDFALRPEHFMAAGPIIEKAVDPIPAGLVPQQTRYIFVVTTDGLRWQEVFEGVDSTLLHEKDFLKNTAQYQDAYWAPTAKERRQKLLPFLWSKVAKEGQIYGNRYLNNCVNTANKMWFSYPGYNEMFSGKPDDLHIFSNNNWTNPNETVFEFLSKQQNWKDRIALFATWDVFSGIFREKKSGLKVCCGSETDNETTRDSGARHFGMQQIPPDFHTWTSAFNHTQQNRPLITYIGLDDTDSQAHKGNYDKYLDAAHRFDTWVAQLWEYIQNDPEYRNRTTLLLTTDHGRGYGRKWTDHHMFVGGSDAIWIAAIGPDTKPLGEVSTPMQLYQQQVAQTIAHLMGQHFVTDHEVAPAISTILRTAEDGDRTIARAK